MCEPSEVVMVSKVSVHCASVISALKEVRTRLGMPLL